MTRIEYHGCLLPGRAAEGSESTVVRRPHDPEAMPDNEDPHAMLHCFGLTPGARRPGSLPSDASAGYITIRQTQASRFRAQEDTVATGRVIGIAGGTGSGKTTVSDMIATELGPDRVVVLVQDHYYRDLSHLTSEQRAAWNFDHPAALDSDLMADHVRALKAGHPVEVPVYDFKTHTRLARTVRVEPRESLIVEGILVLELDGLRELMDLKIYVETDDDLRFIRRLQRDITERGRTLDSVGSQYLETVRPMHREFVEKSRRHADLIVPWTNYNTTAVDMVIRVLRSFR
jgi:uridine kinase